ncbi:MAG TPA: glutamate-1-semialdehyde 2,1-aminomutase [Steroidobacteraceae bacterium]|nr:glutamate-1-semialdehyde 2,1-aminomutase [Steroidobacteraceae bacterium]
MTAERSAALFERARRVTPGGVHSPVRAFRGVGGVPRFMREAAGSRLIDVDGKIYIDFCMSWGPLIFGHQDPHVRAAVEGALSRGWSYGTAESGSLELAEWICRRIPWVEQIRFVNSGTEAVMSALRLARAATGRTRILKFHGCYHGHVDSMLVKAGSGLAEATSPDSAGVSAETAANTLVVPLDDSPALQEVFARHGRSIAAVIVEPLPANFGLLPQRPEFLKELVELAHANGALVIFDEVISGFRVALGGMAERLGVKPDLVTYGKVIGGGFPVGAFAGRRDLMEQIAPVGPVYQAGTLSANPVAMAAGLATLSKLESHSPYATLERLGALLTDALQAVIARTGTDLQVQRDGSLFWLVAGAPAGSVVRCVETIPASQRQRFATLFHSLLERGIYLAPSGFEVGFLSTAHSHADLDQFVAAFEAALGTPSAA